MPQSRSEKKAVSLMPDLLVITSSARENGHLVGSKCRMCGETFFPKRHHCARCTSADVDEIRLGRKGSIFTYTISRATPPGSIMKAPYGIAQIQLPEGTMITAVLAECNLETLSIGQEAELVVEKVKEDEAGNDVMSFKFKPL